MKILNLLVGLIILFIGWNKISSIITFEYIIYAYPIATLLMGIIIFRKNKLIGLALVVGGIGYGAAIFIEIAQSYVYYINIAIIVIGILLIISSFFGKIKKKSISPRSEKNIPQKNVKSVPIRGQKKRVFRVSYNREKKDYYVVGGFSTYRSTSKEGLKKLLSDQYPGVEIVLKDW